MKIVGVKGNSFTVDGEPKHLLMRSSFKLMSWINGAVEIGMGGDSIKADLWLARVKDQGFDGVRVFGETEDWRRGGHPFFGAFPYNEGVWGVEALKRGERPLAITRKNALMIDRLAWLLDKHGLIAEYVVDATLKHTPGISAAMISQCIRVTARHLREQGYTNILLELHNEWDAHNSANLELSELNLQFRRMRRWKHDNGSTLISLTSPGEGWEAEQWPEAIVGVSHGGRDDIEYDVHPVYGANYVAVHPERSGDWVHNPNKLELADLEAHAAPVYFNESKHFDPDFVAHGFSATSSTADLDAYLEFMDHLQPYSFCVHDYVGMASDPDLPLSPLELEFDVQPPAPLPKREYRHLIEQAYWDILGRQADAGGLESYNSGMRTGMTEARMRQSLIDSDEFADKFLDKVD